MLLPHKHNPKRMRWSFIIALLLILLAIIICLSASAGSVNVSPWTTLKIVLNQWLHIPITLTCDPSDIIIISDIRIPRILLAAIAGIALASSGTVFQSLLRNPLADPFVIGVSSGAAVGAVIALSLSTSYTFLGNWSIPLFSLAGGLATILVILFIAGNKSRFSSQTLLLAGVIMNSFFSAIILFLASVLDASRIQSYMFWMIGHIEVTDTHLLFVGSLYVFIGFFVLWLFSKSLNLLSLGSDTATQLGVNVATVQRITFVAASLLASAVVSMTGIIGFVGLVIPHIIRSWVGSDHRILLPASALGGAIFLIISDTLARTLMSPTELPVGVITALLGAPFFIYILRKNYWKRI